MMKDMQKFIYFLPGLDKVADSTLIPNGKRKTTYMEESYRQLFLSLNGNPTLTQLLTYTLQVICNGGLFDDEGFRDVVIEAIGGGARFKYMFRRLRLAYMFLVNHLPVDTTEAKLLLELRVVKVGFRNDYIGIITALNEEVLEHGLDNG